MFISGFSAQLAFQKEKFIASPYQGNAHSNRDIKNINLRRLSEINLITRRAEDRWGLSPSWACSRSWCQALWTPSPRTEGRQTRAHPLTHGICGLLSRHRSAFHCYDFCIFKSLLKKYFAAKHCSFMYLLIHGRYLNPPSNEGFFQNSSSPV